MIPFSFFPKIRVVSELVERHTINGMPYRALIGKQNGVLCIGEYGFVYFESRDEYRCGLAEWKQKETLKSISYSSDNQSAMQTVMQVFLIPNGYWEHYGSLHEYRLQNETEWQAFVLWLMDIADEESIATTIMSPDSRECFIIHPIRQMLFFHDRLGRIKEIGRFQTKQTEAEWILSAVLNSIPTGQMVEGYTDEVLREIDAYSVAVIPVLSVLQWLKEKGLVVQGNIPRIQE